MTYRSYPNSWLPRFPFHTLRFPVSSFPSLPGPSCGPLAVGLQVEYRVAVGVPSRHA